MNKSFPKEKLKDWAILVDGSSFIFRAYYAIPGQLSTSRGFPTKAIFGVTQMLLKILKEFEPKIIIWFGDEKGPTFRHHIYRDYKATRPSMPEDLEVQILYIRKIVESLGIPFVAQEGCEADDLIATFVRTFPLKSIIVAPDKDLYSLVSERTILYDPLRETFLDEEEFFKRFGFLPEAFIHFRALVGDPSDNIKGVPGIGEKTAKALISRFGNLENLYRNLEQILPLKLRETLRTYHQRAFQNLRLLSLKFDAELPSYQLEFYHKSQPDLQTLRTIFKELEFKKLLKEFNFPSEQLIYRTTRITRDELFKFLPVGRMVSLYCETGQGKFFSFPSAPEVYLAPSDTECLAVEFTPALLSLGKNTELVIHDLKKTLYQLENQKIVDYFTIFTPHSPKIYDTKLMGYLLDPGKKDYELSDLAFQYLDLQFEKNEEACKRAIVVRKLGKTLKTETDQTGLTEWLRRVEVPLSFIIYRMEKEGIKIDVPYVKKLNQEFGDRLKELEDSMFSLAEAKFNPRSPQEVAKVLFEKLKLPKIKHTSRGEQPSTDIEVLEELRSHHPIVEILLQYRNIYKLKSTYLEVILKQTNPKDHRLRTIFNQTGTATGRLSSQNPNLQNIPVKGEEGLKIRKAFIAEDGWFLCSLDYSQIELRILAHFSGDENLLSAFLEGVDIHTKTACEVFSVPLEKVTPEMRRVAKVVNFGIAYGMSPYGLAKELNIDQPSAALYIKRYFERYPGVKTYIEATINYLQENGFVKTIVGRKRYIPEIFSSHRNIRDLGYRMAINTPIQGSAADLIKAAMVALFTQILSRNLKSKILLQVHDELILEVPQDELEEIKGRAIETMKNPFEKLNFPFQLKVPIEVNFVYGRTWADCKES